MNKSQHLDFISATLCKTDDTFWQFFNALGDCVRYRIVKVLMYHRNISVSDLADICSVTVPAISQHLRVLERVGAINKNKEGRTIYCELNRTNPYVKPIMNIIDAHLNSTTRSRNA